LFEECWYPDKLHQKETSKERMLREQLATEQESFAALIDQVDELKRTSSMKWMN
jgi:hypothetical protein